MMLVTERPGEQGGALGIVSLEDVIEELIGEEIIDETDLFLDVANKIKVVRRPQIRTGAAKKLTPLLKGEVQLHIEHRSYEGVTNPCYLFSPWYRCHRTKKEYPSE